MSAERRAGSASRYAAETDVSVERSKSELERILVRYGAHEFGYAWTSAQAEISFALRTRRVRILLPLPDRHDESIRLTPTTRRCRSPTAAQQAYEQACRQAWRALCLVVKAKLEAVSAGISTLEREFLPDMLLPDGRTVSEWIVSEVERAIASGRMPRLLPGAADGDKHD